MILICFVMVISVLVLYSALIVGKQADDVMRLLDDKRLNNVEGVSKVESQREIVKSIENEIRKGSVPARFERLEFVDDSYHIVESQAKLNELLNYFFRTGPYETMADRQVKSNIYMDAIGRKVDFRMAKSVFDRKGMEQAIKRRIKKIHPSFDGDVYLEIAYCRLTLPESEVEKRRCNIQGEEATALIFTKKHLINLYLQCLISRKETMLNQKILAGFSEICNRIYCLENVEVLFQCLLMDQMKMDHDQLHVQFSTVYALVK